MTCARKTRITAEVPREDAAYVDDMVAALGMSRAAILREAVREWRERHPLPPPPAWVAEAVAELQEARRKVEASTRAFWALVEAEVQSSESPGGRSP